MTNKDQLNEILEDLIKNTKDSDTRILASRMKNDEKFCVSALGLFSVICCKCPAVVDSLNQIMIIERVKKFINNKD